MIVDVSHIVQGVTLTHRVEVVTAKGEISVYGAENLTKTFTSNPEWQMFVQLITSMSSGQYGEFTWVRQ